MESFNKDWWCIDLILCTEETFLKKAHH